MIIIKCSKYKETDNEFIPMIMQSWICCKMKKGWVGIGANKAYIKQIIVYLAKWNEDIVMNIYIYIYIHVH